MEITTALVLKIVGGFIVGTAHRTIAKLAKEESTGWWLTAMFVPGGSVLYGLRRSKECLPVVGVMFVGFLVLGGGIGLRIYENVREVQKMAAAGPAIESYAIEGEESEDLEEEIPATPIPATATPPPASNAALPAAAQVPRRLQPKLKKLTERYAKLTADRAKLDVNNEDAVRAFNLRAEDYQAACRQFRSELAH